MSGNKFQIKRTGVSGRQPNTTNSSNSAYIDVGELALNFSDYILYSSDGNTAFEIGATVTDQTITGTLTANGTVGTDGQVLTSNGSGIYWGVGGGASFDWTEITADYTASSGDLLLADTTANSFTVTLPATPSVGDAIQIADGGNWSLNNLFIDRNGSTIEGDANNLILDVGDILVYFIYGGDGPTWQVKATLGEKGETGNTGPPGIEISNTEPSNTELLWADTSEEGENVLPSGGATGQYLVKTSNGDFDAEWINLESDLETVSGNIVPSVANTYDLGSANNTWRDLYLSGNSIFLGNAVITETEWDEVSTGVLPYDGTISGLTANTIKEAIDETVALTNTAYANAVAYADTVGNTVYANAVSYTDGEIAALVDTAPDLLNTLNELSAAINDDPDFANSVTNQITTAYSNAVSYTDAEITALGLGSISTQNSNSVSITGGSVSGITDLAIADGGTGASDAGTARTNLGLGTIATQNNNSVDIDGGTIDGTAVNATTLTASGDVNFDSGTLFVDASTDRVGIGTITPSSKLQVVADSATQLLLQALNTNNNVDTDPTITQTIARLGRVGKTGVTFSSEVDFGISRYENAATNSRTQMDIRLAHGATGTPEATVMTLRSNGNVGIGTTSPTQKLTTNGNVAVGGQQAFWYRDDDGFSGSAGRRAWATTANFDAFGTLSFKVATAAEGDPLSGTTAMLIDSSGNVGIGTTAPAENLDVNGEARFRQTGGQGGGPIEISDRTGSNSQNILWNIYYDGSNWRYRNSDYGGSWGFTVGGDMIYSNHALGTAGNTATFRERFMITEAGNVGIGTTAPSNFSGGGLTLGTTSAGKNIILNSSNNGNNGLLQFIDLNGNDALQLNGTTNDVNIYGYGSRPMRFFTNGTERMRIDSSGNVGVGTTAPSGKLDVRGTQVVKPKVDSGKMFKSVFSAGSAVTTDLLTFTGVGASDTLLVIVDVIAARSEGSGAGITRYMTGVRIVSGTATPQAITEISSSTLLGTNPKATLSWSASGVSATLSVNNNTAFTSTMYEVSVASYGDGTSNFNFIG